MKRIAKFIIEHLVKDTLASAGTQIGEAIGKRIGAHIYTPPEPEEKENSSEETKPA